MDTSRTDTVHALLTLGAANRHRTVLVIASLLLLMLTSWKAESGGKQKEAFIFLGPSAFSPDGKYVAAGLRFGAKGSGEVATIEKVFLWDVERGKFLR